MKGILLTVAGIAAFVLILYLSVGAASQVECTACITYGGHTDCRTVKAATRKEAESGAVSNACALLAGGVNDTMRCNGTPPDSLECREP